MKKPSLIITIIIALSCIMNASNIPQGFSAGDKHISLTPIEDTKKELSIVGKYSLKEAVRCVTTEKDAERTTTQQEQFQLRLLYYKSLYLFYYLNFLFHCQILHQLYVYFVLQ